MGTLTITYLVHNFPTLNSWINRFFFFGGPFSFELDKFDCTSESILYFCFWYLKSVWNQFGVLYWNWIPVFVIPVFMTFRGKTLKILDSDSGSDPGAVCFQNYYAFCVLQKVAAEKQ